MCVFESGLTKQVAGDTDACVLKLLPYQQDLFLVFVFEILVFESGLTNQVQVMLVFTLLISDFLLAPHWQPKLFDWTSHPE